MMDLIQKFFSSNSRDKAGSKNIAKERLQFVLLQDKLEISPRNLEKIKDELIAVLSKYVEIDREYIDITLNKIDTSTAIIANIPVKKKKG